MDRQSPQLGARGQQALDAIRAEKVVAILRGHENLHIGAAATTLVENGIGVVEVALTTPGALPALERICSSAPSHACVGAGTVLTEQAARQAVSAGASYLVTPVVLPEVIAAAARLEVPVLAGALTPTEILTAYEAGAQFVKVFPAAFGGPSYIKAVREPLPHIPLVPTGGVRIDDVSAYLAAGAVAVGLGGQLIGDALDGGNLAELAERAKRLTRSINVAATPS